MLAGVVLMMVGCAPSFLLINDLHVLEKGMTKEAVAKLLPRKPDIVKSFVHEGKRYETEGYDLQTAQVQTQSSSYGAPSGGASLNTRTTNFTNTFICLYDQGKLRYWGLKQDYSKSEDPEIQALSKEVYNSYPFEL